MVDIDSPPRLRIVELAAGDPRWESALPVLQELRPHLTVELLAQVLADDAPGPRFLAAFESVPDAATAAPSAPAVCLGVAGWRVIANTSTGRKLYVDDLVTASGVRSGGVGAALLGELERRARAAGCTVLDLDSGVQRFDAHRFYLRERLSIVSHHFAKTL